MDAKSIVKGFLTLIGLFCLGWRIYGLTQIKNLDRRKIYDAPTHC
jgi:hypothetical protein